MNEMEVDRADLLAIVAHPDDAELICGGTLRKTAKQGYRTAILDLTGGESGTWGTPQKRAMEAEKAAEILGVSVRRNAGLPDGALSNDNESRKIVAEIIREIRPETIILHWREGRHPDHTAASQLGHDAAFLAGLENAPIKGEPHRPRKVIYALAYREEPIKPTFVVDITEEIDDKLDAIFAYHSQLEGKTALGEIFGGGERPIREQILAHAAHYGSLIRRPYGEPFWTRETVQIEDLVTIPVNSF